MKLKSEIIDSQSLPGRKLLHACQDEMEHDAIVAHALMQAQDEFWKRGDLEDLDARDAVEAIGARAAEILAGWMGEE